MRRLLSAASRRRAMISSRSFRTGFREGDRYRFFASCCVMVLPPRLARGARLGGPQLDEGSRRWIARGERPYVRQRQVDVREHTEPEGRRNEGPPRDAAHGT